MQQQVGVDGFFQGGLESFYQLVRQFVDEIYGVGDYYMFDFIQIDVMGSCVQCGEELVGGIYVSFGQ